jgi:cation diffusion facilitator CzcD-associated flavoprotein CzcO
MNFNHKIIDAHWNEQKAKWILRIDNGGRVFTDECDMFVYAGGNLK